MGEYKIPHFKLQVGLNSHKSGHEADTDIKVITPIRHAIGKRHGGHDAQKNSSGVSSVPRLGFSIGSMGQASWLSQCGEQLRRHILCARQQGCWSLDQNLVLEDFLGGSVSEKIHLPMQMTQVDL